jgi:hypothetical protein
MKKGKIFLAGLALFVAIGGAFAFKTQAFAPNDVFYKNGATYEKECSLTTSTVCSFASSTGTSGLYYTLSGSTYTVIPNNTSLYALPE